MGTTVISVVKNTKISFAIYLTFKISCRCSVAKSWPTLCDPTDCSMSGFPVLHCLLELPQTHVHWDGDAIHRILCRPLLLLSSTFPSIRVFPNESVFASGGQSIGTSALDLSMNIQSWFKLLSVELVMLSHYLFLGCSLLLLSFSASGLFQWVSSLQQVAKVLGLQ